MPQPIDLQTELARTEMAARIQEMAGRGALVGMQRDRLDDERLKAEAETKVEDTQKTQGEHIDKDGRRKNPFVKRRRKKRLDETKPEARVFYTASEEKRIAEDEGGQHLDVTV